jgi:DNA-binding MarR family transcriptional regulator
MGDRIHLDDTTRQFFGHLWRGGTAAYWWYLDDQETYTDRDGVEREKKRTVWFPPDKMPDFVNPGPTEHTYFGIHSARHGGKKWERSQLHTIEAVNCLFAEFDGDQSLDDVRQLEPPPSMIAESSPGKYHAYWLLDVPWHLDSTDARKRAAAVQAAWVRLTDSDDGSKDLARVLRVPGTFNVKSGYAPDYPTVHWLKTDLDLLYSIDTLITECEMFIVAERAPDQPLSSGGIADTMRHGGVVSAFNTRIEIDTCLRQYGYSQRGNRYVRPGGSRPLAFVDAESNRSFHHSGDDPMANGYWKRPFDLFLHYEYDGDMRAAVRAAADLMGIRGVHYEQKNGHHHEDGRSAPKNRTHIEQTSNSPSGSERTNRTHIEQLQQPTRLIHADDLDNLPDIDWLIEGQIPRGVLAQVFGEPGQGKSHLLLDLALSVAQYEPVVYIAAEDELQYKGRKQTWCNFHQVGSGQLYFWTVPLNLFNQNSIDAFVVAIAALNPALIILDPLAQCAAGHDIDKTADMTLAVAALNDIKRRCDHPTMLVCHHTGWNADHERGSSVLRGACRVVYKLSNSDGLIALECRKMNNAAEPEPRYFRLMQHVESVVLMPARKIDMRDAPLSKRQREVLEALTLTTLRDATFTQLVEHTGIRKGTMNNSLSRLVDRGYVVETPAGSRSKVYNIAQAGREYLETGESEQNEFDRGSELGGLNWAVSVRASSIFRERGASYTEQSNSATECSKAHEDDESSSASSIPVRSQFDGSVGCSFAPPSLGGANNRTTRTELSEAEKAAVCEHAIDDILIVPVDGGYTVTTADKRQIIGRLFASVDDADTALRTAHRRAPPGPSGYGVIPGFDQEAS